MALKPGQVDVGFTDSMAAAMEEALLEHWPDVMRTATPPFDSRFLKLFFVAVSQGVVRHLEENPTSFKVSVSETSGGRFTGQVSDVVTDGVDPQADGPGS